VSNHPQRVIHDVGGPGDETRTWLFPASRVLLMDGLVIRIYTMRSRGAFTIGIDRDDRAPRVGRDSTRGASSLA
jgi:hypothetical protein